jgi:hypothetical protein
MTKTREPDHAPWVPTMDSPPMFNPFANPVEHLGDPEPAFPPDEIPTEEPPPEAPPTRASSDRPPIAGRLPGLTR